MYYYIYDSVAQSKDMRKEIAQIESRLLDFGIKDKTVKISPLRSVREAVADAYQRTFDTIVVVGEDPIVLSILKHIVGYNIVLGVIPLGKQTRIGDLLKIPHGSAACETISARKINTFSIGKASDECFFTHLLVVRGIRSFVVQDQYQVFPPEHCALCVLNNGRAPEGFSFPGQNPHDGKFSIIVSQKKTGFFAKDRGKETSFWRSKKLFLELEKECAMELDGVVFKKPLTEIQLLPNAIKCIVGKINP